MKFLWAVIFILCITGNVAVATPRTLVAELGTNVRTILKAGDVEKANLLFLESFDVTEFGKRCLVDHWDEFTKEEQNRYMELLRDNLQGSIKKRMFVSEKDKNFQLKVIDTKRNSDRSIKVTTSLRLAKGDFPLGIHMMNGSKGLMIVDYDVEGVLLSRQYRGQFNHIIRNGGKTALFDKMEKKLLK